MYSFASLQKDWKSNTSLLFLLTMQGLYILDKIFSEVSNYIYFAFFYFLNTLFYKNRQYIFDSDFNDSNDQPEIFLTILLYSLQYFYYTFKSCSYP